MKTFICKGRSEITGEIFKFEIQAKDYNSATMKAKDACFSKDLQLIELKEKDSNRDQEIS